MVSCVWSSPLLSSFPLCPLHVTGRIVCSESDRASVGVAFPTRKGEEVSPCSGQPPQTALVASRDLGWLLGIMFSHGWTVPYSVVCELEARPFSLTLKIEFSLSVLACPVFQAAVSPGGSARVWLTCSWSATESSRASYTEGISQTATGSLGGLGRGWVLYS